MVCMAAVIPGAAEGDQSPARRTQDRNPAVKRRSGVQVETRFLEILP